MKADSSPLYQLTFEERDGYLYAHVEAEQDSYEVSMGFWKEIAAKTKATGARRVLVEENIATNVSFPDAFKVGAEIPQLGFGNARIAFVDLQHGHEQINDFGELVAVNRGFNLMNFADSETAIAWLFDNQ